MLPPRILGMHLPNKAYRAGRELDAFLADDRPVTMLHMQVDQWYRRLRATSPDRLIHVRLYREWWEDTDPRELARWSLRELPEVWADPSALVSPANEQNIELRSRQIHEVQGQDRIRLYDKIGRWNLAFWDEVDSREPGRKARALWSALADGHDARHGVPDSDLQVPAIRDALQRVDVLAAHPYAKLKADPRTEAGGELRYWHMLRPWRPLRFGGEDDPGGLLTQVPGKPLFISETGTFAHDSMPAESLRALRGMAFYCAQRGRRCIGITPFIWDSGPEHAPNLIAGSSVLVHGLASIDDRVHGWPDGGLGDDPPPDDRHAPEDLTGRRYVAHTVKPGDTLWSLAGAEWPRILRAVPMGEPRSLPTGSVVLIPEELT